MCLFKILTKMNIKTNKKRTNKNQKLCDSSITENHIIQSSHIRNLQYNFLILFVSMS